MASLCCAPILLVLLQAGPAPAVPAETVQPVQSKAFGDDGPLQEDDNDLPPGPVDPDGPVGGFVKSCGATCLTSCAMWAVAAVLAVIPVVGWAGSLLVQLANPWVAGLAGWAMLNLLADRRAPALSQMAGMVLPFYVTLLLNFLGTAALTGVAALVALSLALAGSALLMNLGGNANPLAVAAGATTATVTAMVLPTAALLLGATLSVMFLGGAVLAGSALSAVLGVSLGRGFTVADDAFEFDLFRSPGPRVDQGPPPPERDRRPAAPQPPPAAPDPELPPPAAPADPPPPTSSF